MTWAFRSKIHSLNINWHVVHYMAIKMHYNEYLDREAQTVPKYYSNKHQQQITFTNYNIV